MRVIFQLVLKIAFKDISPEKKSLQIYDLLLVVSIFLLLSHSYSLLFDVNLLNVNFISSPFLPIFYCLPNLNIFPKIPIPNFIGAEPKTTILFLVVTLKCWCRYPIQFNSERKLETISAFILIRILSVEIGIKWTTFLFIFIILLTT